MFRSLRPPESSSKHEILFFVLFFLSRTLLCLNKNPIRIRNTTGTYGQRNFFFFTVSVQEAAYLYRLRQSQVKGKVVLIQENVDRTKITWTIFSFSSSLPQSDIFSQVPVPGTRFRILQRLTLLKLKDHLHILRRTVRTVFLSEMRIRDILVGIRICGSVSQALPNESRSGSCYFRQ